VVPVVPMLPPFQTLTETVGREFLRFGNSQLLLCYRHTVGLASERIWFFRRSATISRLIAKLPRPSNLAAFDSKTSDQFVRQASHRREPQTNSLATSNAGPWAAAILTCRHRALRPAEIVFPIGRTYTFGRTAVRVEMRARIPIKRSATRKKLSGRS
jgi:hypothetical protein